MARKEITSKEVLAAIRIMRALIVDLEPPYGVGKTFKGIWIDRGINREMDEIHRELPLLLKELEKVRVHCDVSG